MNIYETMLSVFVMALFCLSLVAMSVPCCRTYTSAITAERELEADSFLYSGFVSVCREASPDREKAFEVWKKSCMAQFNLDAMSFYEHKDSYVQSWTRDGKILKATVRK